MKVVFLVIDYVPHQVLSIKNLIHTAGAEVRAFHMGYFSKDVPSDLRNFETTHYQALTREEMLRQIRDFKPDLLVTAGWSIPVYNWICKQLIKSHNVPIIAMSDTPWYGTLKQKINAFISPFHIKTMFTHIWVAGIRQYDYARKLGFSNQQIIFNSLSAENYIFNQVNIEVKKFNYPKNFVYVGRLIDIKGLRNLAIAWSSISDKKGWTFTLIGNGEMKEELIMDGNFIVKDYLPQDLLVDEMQNSGCFVLPSLKETWAIVLHEAAAAGLPIICTETCGAAPHFVINNYNGYRVCDNSVLDLQIKLERIINMSDKNLVDFCNRSRALSKFINPEIQTASLLQLLNAE